MVKTSEPAIKIVTLHKRNGIDTLGPKGKEARWHAVDLGVPQPYGLPVESRHLTRQTPKAERGNPVWLPGNG
jgi:hypothetical protein